MHGFRGSRSPDRVRGTLWDGVLQRRAADRRDWNPYGSGRATRRRGVDGSAPRSTTGGGGIRDQRASRVERVPACQIVPVRDPAQRSVHPHTRPLPPPPPPDPPLLHPPIATAP